MFVAALCHDIDHPGHTNAFEINISSELAIMYSDDCVLEHHHAATTFRVLRGGAVDAGAAALNAEAAAKCDCNVLNSLTTAQYHEVRKNICRMILMTDMAKHGDTCRELSLQDQGDFESMSSGDSPQTRRELFMDAILHSADLATQTFRTEFALQWGDRVVAEFKDQARRERELGLPVAAYMDGLEDGDNIPTYKLQLGFCQYVLAPMWSQMERLFPDVFKPVYANLKKNISFYQDEIDAAEVRARSGAISIGGGRIQRADASPLPPTSQAAESAGEAEAADAVELESESEDDAVAEMPDDVAPTSASVDTLASEGDDGTGTPSARAGSVNRPDSSLSDVGSAASSTKTPGRKSHFKPGSGRRSSQALAQLQIQELQKSKVDRRAL